MKINLKKLKVAAKFAFLIALVLFLIPISIAMLGLGGEGFMQAGWVIPFLLSPVVFISGVGWLVLELSIKDEENHSFKPGSELDIQLENFTKSVRKTQFALLLILFFLFTNILSSIDLAEPLLLLALLVAAVHLTALLVRKKRLLDTKTNSLKLE